MHLVALRAKGVDPLSSVRGVLHGWRLKFNVEHWFRHEGGMGNIEPSENPEDIVEGVVHECRDEHLMPLDALEAYGVGYDRIEVTVETPDGQVKALTYVGLPAVLNNSCLPSRRYLNILIRGAEAAGLSDSYMDWLRQHPLHIPEEYPKFEFPEEAVNVFNVQTLADHPYLTALAGAVFDMRGADSKMDILHDLFGGKDMTLFHLKRLDTSDGSETLDDIVAGRISERGKWYLNAYLHEYSREFKFVGRYVYKS